MALLRRSVAEKERARAASHVLCRSLADETHQLRRTLAATAHMCQHLAKCLDERQGGQGTAGEPSPEVGPGVSRPRLAPRGGSWPPALLGISSRTVGPAGCHRRADLQLPLGPVGRWP